jgi:xanthine/uracil permease
MHGCQAGVGTEVTTFTSATTSSGRISGSPPIAGRTSFVITSADASGHYTGVLSISTRSGTLTTDDSGVLRSDGTFTEIGQVDGAASTGQFSSAVGVIGINGRAEASDPSTFTALVAALVCT